MDKHILFSCACHLRSCSDCPLGEFGCEEAPEGLLLKAACEHYAEMKNNKGFNLYNTNIAKLFGEDYAKELMAKKAKVC